MAMFGKNNRDEDDVDPGKAVEAKFGELSTKFGELESKVVTKEEFKAVSEGMTTIAEMNAAKENRRKQQEAAAARATEGTKDYNPEDAFNEFAADPRAALNSATARAERIAAVALGKQTRLEVLGGKEYYHGEFKTKVDNMIDTGTTDANALSNVSYILNCYNLVYAEYAQNGKLDDMKRAAAAHGFSDGGSSGKGDSEDKTVKIDFRGQQNYPAAKARSAMEQMGLKDEDLVNAAKEGVINGLEVQA
jgi:hypothetical protein